MYKGKEMCLLFRQYQQRKFLFYKKKNHETQKLTKKNIIF